MIAYDKILEKISNASGLERQEIEQRVEAKIKKLSGLISKEGAAQVVAAELGINFDNEKLKVDELLPGMRRVNIVGKVINTFPVRTFVRNSQENKVANFILADETSNVKVVLWDTHHIELLEKNQIMEGSIVELINGNVRDNEIHLGSFSELKLSNENLGEVKTEMVLKQKNIEDFKISDNIKVRAFIVQIFDPKFFEVCPECKKKVELENENSVCKEHGKVIPEKRALMNIVLDDGTETIRAVLFHEPLQKLGINLDLDSEPFLNQKNNFLGKEMVFSGNVRNNKFFNNPEFIIDGVKEVNMDELIEELEK